VLYVDVAQWRILPELERAAHVETESSSRNAFVPVTAQPGESAPSNVPAVPVSKEQQVRLPRLKHQRFLSATDASAQPQSLSPAPVAPARQSKHPNRATEMEAIHRSEGIGSLRETRELFFEAVEEILSQNMEQRPTVLDLLSRAEQAASKKAEETNYTSERNWHVARRSMQNLFVRAEVLRDDTDQVITEGFGDESRLVSRLEPEFRQLCHAYLAETIIRSSARSLQGRLLLSWLTLFRRGKANAVSPDELKRMADEVLMFLHKKGKIERDGSQIRLRAAPTLVKGFGT